MSEAKRTRDLGMAQSMSVVALVKRISKALDADLVTTYPPGTPAATAAMAKAENVIKQSRLLDLVLEKVLPATFSVIFLSTLKLLSGLGTLNKPIVNTTEKQRANFRPKFAFAVSPFFPFSEDFEQDIYVSEGISKILTSLKENPNDEQTQILGAQLLAYLALDGPYLPPFLPFYFFNLSFI